MSSITKLSPSISIYSKDAGVQATSYLQQNKNKNNSIIINKIIVTQAWKINEKLH